MVKNMKPKLITIHVTSYEGDTEYSMLPKEALKKIRDLERQENKWVFIGQEHVKSETLKESDLVRAMEDDEQIMLVNALAGGDCCEADIPEKAVEIELNIEKKAEQDIVVTLDENDYVIKVNITLKKDRVIELLYNREVIVKALEKKLNNLALAQVNDLKKALRL